MKFLAAAIFAISMSQNAFAKDELKKPQSPQPQVPSQGQAPTAKEPLKQEPLKQEPLKQSPTQQPQAPAQGQAQAKAPVQGQAPTVKEPLKQEPLKQEPLKQEPLKGQQQAKVEQLVDLDQEEMELYQPEMKGKKDIPDSVVLRINTKTGVQSIHYPKQELVAGNLVQDTDMEEIETWDGSNMTAANAGFNIELAPEHGSRWHFNRTRGHNWRHTYHRSHPWGNYYTYPYGPVYNYNRYYDRPYRFGHYRYRPYYHYGVGGHIYRFFRRILD